MNRIDSLLPSIKDKVLEYTYIVNLLGYFHWFRGEFDKAFDRVFHALKLIDKIVENKESGWIYFSLGIFYFDTKDYSNSELNFNKTLLIFKKFDVDYGIARTNTAIASIKIRQNKNQEAIPLLEKAILTFRNGNFYAGLGRALNDLALIEKSNSNYERTIELFNESLAIRTKIEHVQGLITTYTELGEIYLMQKDYKNAFLNLEQGLNYSNSVGAKHKSIRIHKLYSDAYKQTDNIQLAFNHFEKFHDLKSDVLSEESALSISKMQTKFETEKSEKEAEIERIKNVELKIANELISEKQKEILDSIHYAKRIQISLLPTEKYIEKTLNRLKK